MSTMIAFLGGLGTPELLIIGFLILLLFGGAKLPKLMRSIGQGVTEFKKGIHGVEEEIDQEVRKTVAAGKEPRDAD